MKLMHEQIEFPVSSHEKDICREILNDSLTQRDAFNKFRKSFESVCQKDQTTKEYKIENESVSIEHTKLMNKHLILSGGCKSFDYVDLGSSGNNFISYNKENLENGASALISTHQNKQVMCSEGMFIVINNYNNEIINKKDSPIEEMQYDNNQGGFQVECDDPEPLDVKNFNCDPNICKKINKNFLLNYDYLTTACNSTMGSVSLPSSEISHIEPVIVDCENYSKSLNPLLNTTSEYFYCTNDSSIKYKCNRNYLSDNLCYIFEPETAVNEQYTKACLKEIPQCSSASSVSNTVSETVSMNDRYKVKAESSLSINSSSASEYQSALSSSDAMSSNDTPRSQDGKDVLDHSCAPSKGITYAITSQNIPEALNRKSNPVTRDNFIAKINNTNNLFDSKDINDVKYIQPDKVPSKKSLRKLLSLTCAKKSSNNFKSKERIKSNEMTSVNSRLFKERVNSKNNYVNKVKNTKEYNLSFRGPAKITEFNKVRNLKPEKCPIFSRNNNLNDNKKNQIKKRPTTGENKYEKESEVYSVIVMKKGDSKGNHYHCCQQSSILRPKSNQGNQFSSKINTLQILKSVHQNPQNFHLNVLQTTKSAHRLPVHTETNRLNSYKSVLLRSNDLDVDVLQTSKSNNEAVLDSEFTCIRTSKTILEYTPQTSDAVSLEITEPSFVALEKAETVSSETTKRISTSTSDVEKNRKFISRIPRPIVVFKREIVKKTQNLYCDSVSYPLLVKVNVKERKQATSSENTSKNDKEDQFNLNRPSRDSNQSSLTRIPSAHTSTKGSLKENKKVATKSSDFTNQISCLRTKYWHRNKLQPLKKEAFNRGDKNKINLCHPTNHSSQPLLNIKSENKLSNKPKRIQTAPHQSKDQLQEKILSSSDFRPGTSEIKVTRVPSKPVVETKNEVDKETIIPESLKFQSKENLCSKVSLTEETNKTKQINDENIIVENQLT